jgi:hypothetical protein
MQEYLKIETGNKQISNLQLQTFYLRKNDNSFNMEYFLENMLAAMAAMISILQLQTFYPRKHYFSFSTERR